MTTFFQIIGWYSVAVGIMQGLGLLFVPVATMSDEQKRRRILAWISHLLMLFVGWCILTH